MKLEIDGYFLLSCALFPVKLITCLIGVVLFIPITVLNYFVSINENHSYEDVVIDHFQNLLDFLIKR